MDLLDLFNMCSFGLQGGLRALQTFELFFFPFSSFHSYPVEYTNAVELYLR